MTTKKILSVLLFMGFAAMTAACVGTAKENETPTENNTIVVDGVAYDITEIKIIQTERNNDLYYFVMTVGFGENRTAGVSLYSAAESYVGTFSVVDDYDETEDGMAVDLYVGTGEDWYLGISGTVTIGGSGENQSLTINAELDENSAVSVTFNGKITFKSYKIGQGTFAYGDDTMQLNICDITTYDSGEYYISVDDFYSDDLIVFSVVPEADGLLEGTYNVSDDLSEATGVYGLQLLKADGWSPDMVSGTVTIAKQGEIYTITIDSAAENGKTLKGTYTGRAYYYDESTAGTGSATYDGENFVIKYATLTLNNYDGIEDMWIYIGGDGMHANVALYCDDNEFVTLSPKTYTYSIERTDKTFFCPNGYGFDTESEGYVTMYPADGSTFTISKDASDNYTLSFNFVFKDDESVISTGSYTGKVCLVDKRL